MLIKITATFIVTVDTFSALNVRGPWNVLQMFIAFGGQYK